MKITKLAVLAALSLGLIACGGDDAPASPTTGALSISITDAPITGACEVWVEFTSIDLHGPSGTVPIDAADTLDLLSLQGNTSALLASVTDLEAGNYQWMRLKINADEGVTDSNIVFRADCDAPASVDNPETVESLHIPSGAETGLKLNRPFVIAAGGRTDFTIDFDLAKSVHMPGNSGGDYKLRPTLRIVNNLEVGTISGTVATATLTDNFCSADNAKVYLYDGAGITPDDIDTSDDTDVEPITTAIVTFSDPDPVTEAVSGSFEIGFVEADMSYTIALTCNADMDDPATNDTDSGDTNATPPVDPIEVVTFINPLDITVAVDAVTNVEF